MAAAADRLGTFIMAVVARTPWKWLAILWSLHMPIFIVLLGISVCKQLQAGSFEIDKDIESGLRLTLAWTAAIFVSVSFFSTVDTDDLAGRLSSLDLADIALLSCAVVICGLALGARIGLLPSLSSMVSLG
jgi:hypothetical protein